MIRRANVDDAAEIAAIHVRSWRAAYAGILPSDYLAQLSVEKRTEFWKRELSHDGAIVLVATNGQEIVAWSSGGASRDADSTGDAEVYAIYISPHHWNCGIGRALMSQMEVAVPVWSAITVWVLRDNVRAIGFYQALGYAADGTEKTVQIGTTKLTEVRLRKKRPNKSPEPTPTAVTPRAMEMKSEGKRSNLNRIEARVAPAVVVAHL